MPGNYKLDSLDARLERFKLNDTTYQYELQSILRDCSQMLEQYKVLEQASDAKGNGIQLEDAAVVENPRNPYVLFLIDGNGYIFNDELVRGKEEGGMRAARMLNDAVEKYLREALPQANNARVVVRIYADLTNLSKQLAKSKIIGLEKRSLAPFSAAFTRTISHFDFVDALDEEGTKFKIRETFKTAVDDSSCSHILYAACHDSGYLSQLAPYDRRRDRITLVQGAGFNSDFHQFGLNVTQFPTIFRWSELSSTTPTTRPLIARSPPKNAARQSALLSGNWRDSIPITDPAYVAGDRPLAGSTGLTSSAVAGKHIKPDHQEMLEQPCKYFQKGICRFGNKCSFQHVPNAKGNSDQPFKVVALDRSSISSVLPTTEVTGFIHLNKDNQRIDSYIRPPTQDEWILYNAHFHQQKPCNDHHLQGTCTRLKCPYDHHPLSYDIRHCLEYVVKCSPCPRKGACRSIDCFFGHICQKNDCVGQMKGCKMKMEMHDIDPVLASLVPVVEENLMHEDSQGAWGNASAMW